MINSSTVTNLFDYYKRSPNSSRTQNHQQVISTHDWFSNESLDSLRNQSPDTTDIPLKQDVQLIICLSECCHDVSSVPKLMERFQHVYNRVLKEEGTSSPFVQQLKSAYQKRFHQTLD